MGTPRVKHYLISYNYKIVDIPSLFEHYREILKTKQMSIFFAGYMNNMDEATLVYFQCDKYFRKEALGEKKFVYQGKIPIFIPNCRNVNGFKNLCTDPLFTFSHQADLLQTEIKELKEKTER